MNTDSSSDISKRPLLEDFEDPVAFVEAMLSYRKQTERGFSILRATKGLRRVSPALVSLVISRKRTLTPDRADEFAKLLGLTAAERHFFKSWIGGTLTSQTTSRLAAAAIEAAPLKNSFKTKPERKDVSTHILRDWLNIYVKDLFMFEEVQAKPEIAEKILLHIATPKRVRQSIAFLLREGHLRRTLDGRIVLDTPLAVADPKVPSAKIRAFHKAALGIAQKAIDRVEPTERLANTVILPLNEKSYRELTELISEFAEKLKDFAESHQQTSGSALYQLIVNAAPIGGKLK